MSATTGALNHNTHNFRVTLIKKSKNIATVHNKIYLKTHNMSRAFTKVRPITQPTRKYLEKLTKKYELF